MIRVQDLTARVRRLEQLAQGLCKEVALWREGNDPALYLERKAYLKELQQALAGLEGARVVLHHIHQRCQKKSPLLAEAQKPQRKDKREK